MPRRVSRIHFAWWVALTAGLVYFVQGGLGSYALGVLLPAWVAEFGWPRTLISIAYTIGTLLPGLSGVLVGRWADRYGPRWIIIAGAAISGLSYILLAGTSSLLYFFVAFTIGAIGKCGLSQVPSSVAITQWFVTKRAMAMGLATTGISLAGVILVPVITWLIATFGWRITVIVLGIAVWLLVIPLAFVVLGGSPASRGLEPYGAGTVERQDRQRPEPKTTLSRAVHGGMFWLLAVALTLGQTGANAIGLHALPAILDKGVGPPDAAAAISLMAACAVAGKLLYGWGGDRISPTVLLAVAVLQSSTGYLFLALAGPGAGVWAFAVIYGLSLGGTASLQGVVVAHIFGVASYGAIFGAIGLPTALASTASPVLAGGIRDVSGSYTPAFLLFAALSFCGAAALLLTELRTRRQ